MNRHAAIFSVATLIALGSLVIAGSLNPPTGVVTPTMKPLTEIEPRIAINVTYTPGDADSLYKITQPGSYYLAYNIIGTSGKHGIEIASSGVTLDLNGFDLLGVPGSLDGVTTTSQLTGITVLNGSVREWGGVGVKLSSAGQGVCRVENVRASGNLETGIRTGIGDTVSKCSADNNGIGIITGSGGTIINCAANNNSSTGIQAGTGAMVTNSAAHSNAIGFSVGSGCSITGCSAALNAFDGFNAGVGCVITDCSAYNNDNNGIQASFVATVTGCTVYSNADFGINVNGDSMITACSARDNGEAGINAAASTISGCTSNSNIGHGIRVTGESRVTENTCDGNGAGGLGYGVYSTGSGNRIENNNCTGNDFGIVVDTTVNLVFGNSCRGNSGGNYSIASGNRVGVIVTPPISGPISGNSGAAGLGTIDPWANFAF